MSKLGKSEMLHGKKYIRQQKEMFQEDDYGSRTGLLFAVKVFLKTRIGLASSWASPF